MIYGVSDKMSRNTNYRAWGSVGHYLQGPGLLEEMGFSYDPQVGAFKARVTRQFPEKFAEWAKQLPKELIFFCT